jgi:hypothetical protein
MRWSSEWELAEEEASGEEDSSGEENTVMGKEPPPWRVGEEGMGTEGVGDARDEDGSSGRWLRREEPPRWLACLPARHRGARTPCCWIDDLTPSSALDRSR